MRRRKRKSGEKGDEIQSVSDKENKSMLTNLIDKIFIKQSNIISQLFFIMMASLTILTLNAVITLITRITLFIY